MTLSEFSKRLGMKNPSSLQGKHGKKYKKYVTYQNGKNPYVTEEACARCLRDIEEKKNIAKRCSLFTEFLNKHLEIPYRTIAVFVGDHTDFKEDTLLTAIKRSEFTVDMGYQVIDTYREHNIELLKEFDEFYDWRTV